jgi:hypothetical protein
LQYSRIPWGTSSVYTRNRVPDCVESDSNASNERCSRQAVFRMNDYDWTGLRLWRTAFAASLLLFLPVSCFVASAVNPLVFPSLITGVFVGLLVIAGTLYGVREWSCPRCGSSFARRPKRPWVAPWASLCSVCTLPEYTPTEAAAPPIVTQVASQEIVAPLPKVSGLQRLGDRRTRVALIFAIPLLYLTMCRLPAGDAVKTPSGRELRVLSVMRNKLWMSGHGTIGTLEVAYYSATPGDSSELRDALNLVIPRTAPSDSIILLGQISDSWWLKATGIKVEHSYPFKRQSDGTWAPGM